MRQEPPSQRLVTDSYRMAEPLRIASGLVHVHIKAVDVLDEWERYARAEADVAQASMNFFRWSFMNDTVKALGRLRPAIAEATADYALALVTARPGAREESIQGVVTIKRKTLMSEGSIQGVQMIDFVVTPKTDRTIGVARIILREVTRWAETSGRKMGFQLEPQTIAYFRKLFSEDLPDEGLKFQIVTLDFPEVAREDNVTIVLL